MSIFSRLLGNELRKQLNAKKVQLDKELDEAKNIDLTADIDEATFNEACEDVKEVLSECKLLRAQAKAVARELATRPNFKNILFTVATLNIFLN